MWVYSTRLFWGLEHPPNLNWREWTVLLAGLTFACIRVKLVTSVIAHVLLPFIPVTPINPGKCDPDFTSLLYHQEITFWVPKHLYTANSLKTKMSVRVQAGKRCQDLFCLVETVFNICPGWWVAPRKLRTLSLGNWAYNFIWILWVTEDTGLCQPACKITFPFWKRTLLKLNTKMHGVAIPA